MRISDWSSDVGSSDLANGNSTLAAIQTSSEFLAIATGTPAAAAFGLQSIYGADVFSDAVNPKWMRTVNIDYNPTYFAKEEQYQAKLCQNFGNIALNVTGGYAANSVESTTDYIQSVQRSLAGNPGLMNLAGAAALGGPSSPFAPIVAALMPNGPGGPFCQSAASPNDGGVYSGASVGCFNQSLDLDRQSTRLNSSHSCA